MRQLQDERTAELERDLSAVRQQLKQAQEAQAAGEAEVKKLKAGLSASQDEKSALEASVRQMTDKIEHQFEEEVAGWRKRLAAAQGESQRADSGEEGILVGDSSRGF